MLSINRIANTITNILNRKPFLNQKVHDNYITTYVLDNEDEGICLVGTIKDRLNEFKWIKECNHQWYTCIESDKQRATVRLLLNKVYIETQVYLLNITLDVVSKDSMLERIKDVLKQVINEDKYPDINNTAVDFNTLVTSVVVDNGPYLIDRIMNETSKLGLVWAQGEENVYKTEFKSEGTVRMILCTKNIDDTEMLGIILQYIN